MNYYQVFNITVMDKNGKKEFSQMTKLKEKVLLKKLKRF